MLFNVIGIACLVFAFAVLVVTFLWIARLLAMKSQQRAAQELQQAIAQHQPPSVEAAAEAGEEDEEATAAEERRGMGRAVILGANLSLVLGILSCALFWFSPLFSVLSAAAIYYAVRCLWMAWRNFRIFVLRAFAGLILSAVSLVLLYLQLSGQLASVLPFLGGA